MIPLVFVSCCSSVKWRFKPARPASHYTHTRTHAQLTSPLSSACPPRHFSSACVRPAVRSIGGKSLSLRQQSTWTSGGGGIITRTRTHARPRTEGINTRTWEIKKQNKYKQFFCYFKLVCVIYFNIYGVFNRFRIKTVRKHLNTCL